ncbi:hypothetical protein ACLB2K_026226 [Fragaria x ananassa]
MLDCKPIETPIEMNHNLVIYPNQVPIDKGRYQCLVGRLIYLSHTRLDIEVATSKKGISLSQRKYVLDLLTETGMLDCKLVETPIEMNHNLAIYLNQVPTNKGRYQRLVGRLIYLSHTRPDIEVARSKKGISLSQRKYVLDLLAETGMLDCKPVETPILR